VTTGAMSGKRSLILSYRESISVLVKVERDGSWTVVASGMVGPVAAVAYNNARTESVSMEPPLCPHPEG
jgi:hypothetical protein